MKATTAIRRIAVRETGASRHDGGPIKAPRTSQHYRIEEIKGGSQSVPHYAERHQPLRQPM